MLTLKINAIDLTSPVVFFWYDGFNLEWVIQFIFNLNCFLSNIKCCYSHLSNKCAKSLNVEGEIYLRAALSLKWCHIFDSSTLIHNSKFNNFLCMIIIYLILRIQHLISKLRSLKWIFVFSLYPYFLQLWLIWHDACIITVHSWFKKDFGSEPNLS